MNNSIIVVEIPHQRPPLVWEALNNEQIIDIAYSQHDLYYAQWTPEDAADCFDGDDMPGDLGAILKSHGVALEAGYGDHKEFYALADAESELDVAKEAIAHDLARCFFLTMPEEAREFAESYSGHQAVEARLAVKEKL